MQPRSLPLTPQNYQLRESGVPYGDNFIPENDLLRLQNGYYWDDII
jgi:hypothetical protein